MKGIKEQHARLQVGADGWWLMAAVDCACAVTCYNPRDSRKQRASCRFRSR